MLRRVPTICVLMLPALVGFPLFERDAVCQTFPLSDIQQGRISGQEIVLLDNGRVLQGQVTRTADKVNVTTREGSLIVLSNNRVDVILDSLEDVWQHRNSKLEPDDVQGHLSLFHWCLKHRMKEPSQQQLNHLMLTKLDVKRLRYLDRLIVQTFEQTAAKRLEHANTIVARETSKNSYTFKPLPPVELEDNLQSETIVDRAIALASHMEPTVPARIEAGEKKARPKAQKKSIRKELDSMTDLLARDDLHQFQRRIQPVLLKGCLAAKCHHSSAVAMPLMHRGRGQLVPKRFTQRNLQSIIRWIDSSNVLESRLLTQAATAHGGQELPAMQPKSSEFERLSAWIEAVAKNSPDLIGDSSKSRQAERVVSIKTERSPQLPALQSAESVGTVAPSPDERTAAPSDDPFDPEAFNHLPK